MIGSESIDIGLKNIWRSWFVFRKGKRRTAELENFEYHLEKNLCALFEDLNTGAYFHGGYKKFIVRDNKQREISVAGIRDRVVHRIAYDYLVPIYDKTFIYDAWSCRKNKERLIALKTAATEFLKNHLNLAIHPACQKIFKAKHGLKFLGVVVRPWERLLNRRNMKRSHSQLSLWNAASYRGLILKYGTSQERKEFSWAICERLS